MLAPAKMKVKVLWHDIIVKCDVTCEGWAVVEQVSVEVQTDVRL